MNDTSMRGSRLGAVSYENDAIAEPAERMLVRYACAKGHDTLVPFSVEAEEIPTVWECRCGLSAAAVVRVDRMTEPSATCAHTGTCSWSAARSLSWRSCSPSASLSCTPPRTAASTASRCRPPDRPETSSLRGGAPPQQQLRASRFVMCQVCR